MKTRRLWGPERFELTRALRVFRASALLNQKDAARIAPLEAGDTISQRQ